MLMIPDDPIIKSMERTGYPPWMEDDEGDAWGYANDEWEDENEEEEEPDC